MKLSNMINNTLITSWKQKMDEMETINWMNKHASRECNSTNAINAGLEELMQSMQCFRLYFILNFLELGMKLKI